MKNLRIRKIAAAALALTFTALPAGDMLPLAGDGLAVTASAADTSKAQDFFNNSEFAAELGNAVYDPATFTVTLTGDVTMKSSFDYYVKSYDAGLRIDLAGHTLHMPSDHTYVTFDGTNGLKNVSFTDTVGGGKITSYIRSGYNFRASFITGDNVSLDLGNISVGARAIARGENSSVTMNGGTVDSVRCEGKNSAFTMVNGNVDNYVGGYNEQAFSINIMSGSIGGNIYTDYGTYSADRKLTISGGSIAKGIETKQTLVRITGGELYDDPGSQSRDSAAISVVNGRLELSGGTVNGHVYAGYYFNGPSTVLFTGGTINCEPNGHSSSLKNAALRICSGTVYISDNAVINSTEKFGVFVDGDMNSKLVMTGGSITAPSGVYADTKSSSFAVSGGSINGTGPKTDAYTGCGIYAEKANANNSITGGVITGSNYSVYYPDATTKMLEGPGAATFGQVTGPIADIWEAPVYTPVAEIPSTCKVQGTAAHYTNRNGNKFILKDNIYTPVGDGDVKLPLADHALVYNQKGIVCSACGAEFSSDNIPDTDGILGDVNGDNAITAKDLVITKRYINGYINEISVLADMDGNGNVSTRDYVLLKRKYNSR